MGTFDRVWGARIFVEVLRLLILVGLVSGSVFDVPALEFHLDILRYATCYSYSIDTTNVLRCNVKGSY